MHWSIRLQGTVPPSRDPLSLTIHSSDYSLAAAFSSFDSFLYSNDTLVGSLTSCIPLHSISIAVLRETVAFRSRRQETFFPALIQSPVEVAESR